MSIFSASREQRSLDKIRPLESEDGLITRPAHEVQVRLLPPGAADFFRALMTGATLAEAASLAIGRQPGFDLPGAISAMLEAGIFSACSLSPAKTEHPQ